MKSLAFILALLLALSSCGQTKKYDLVIKNANVFDSKTGTVSNNQTVLIQAGIIRSVSNQKGFIGKNAIDAKGKLVTPGFIDTHIHPTDVFGDYNAAPDYLPRDCLDFLRQKLLDTYMPYGVTTVMVMGQPENWLPPVLNWSANPLPNYLDIYTVGGALISEESRKPYINHITVGSSLEAKQKVLQYCNLGIRHKTLLAFAKT